MAGIPYTVNTEDSTSPADNNVASNGAAEIRGLKSKLNNVFGILFTAAGTADAMTATLPAFTTGLKVIGIPIGENTVVLPTLNGIPIVKRNVIAGNIIPLVAGDYNAGNLFSFTGMAAGYLGAPAWVLNAPDNNRPFVPGTKQTVYVGGVDANGLSQFFLAAIGTTTAAAGGPLYATCTAGENENYWGNATLYTWTDLNINGQMYLGINIDSAGVFTGAFSTTLAPIYQWGGNPSTVNGQYTYNIAIGKMFKGNGVSADQVYAVFIGEVTVAAGVISVVTCYALNGKYRSPPVAIVSGTSVVVDTNIGCIPMEVSQKLVCTTAEHGYSIGDVITNFSNNSAGTHVATVAINKNTITMLPGTAANAYYALHKVTGAQVALTNANWNQYVDVNRGW